MSKANSDIRELASANKVYLWEIAAKLGITDNSFSRKLRFELNQDTKQHIRDIIENIVKERETA